MEKHSYLCAVKKAETRFFEKRPDTFVNLIGEYTVSIDNKCRLRLPTALLRQLGERPDGDQGYAFVINRGFEKCMALYPKKVWDEITAKISKLNRFNERNRMFFRTFYLGAAAVETDAADRILLPKALMEYAGVSDEAILVAMDDRIEIWSRQEYDKMMSINPEDFADLANEVMGDNPSELSPPDL